MTQEQIFLLCLFGVVAALSYACCLIFLRDPSARLVDRLKERADDGQPPPRPRQKPVSELLTKIGRVAGRLFEPKTRRKQSDLRRRLGYAGLYTNGAIRLFAGVRVICLGGGALGGYLLGVAIGGQQIAALAGLSAGGLAGYLLPMLWLKWRIARQQTALEHALPDAIDLMVVCVEAGLTMDASLQRVGREIALPHPALARELAITHMETQMGVSRADALRNLATRTGSAALQSLTAMLVQAERFGTSIGQTLRVHAESLRLKRQYAAEERAAKATVKLVFPVALLIFPTVLMVLIGPAIIQMFMTGFIGNGR